MNTECTKYADVFVGFPVEGSFTYAVPDGSDVRPGMRVRVDFRNRQITAFVHRVHDTPPVGFEAKNIVSAIDPAPIFDGKLLDLAGYMASSYLCTEGEALSMSLPSGERPSKRYAHPFELKPPVRRDLTAEQQSVYDDILRARDEGSLLHLLFGITGSGKTEIYIELAQSVIRQGKSVIYLVPEISLSSQTFERLYNVFGDDLIVYHSHLTANQRLHNWMRFFRGDAKIAIGTRSAVFLQCPALGLVVVDEEHDSSYKEHSTPRYNARRLAVYRCRQENALLVMGSATPSVESLYSAERRMFILHRLKGRFGEALLPQIEVVRINHGRPDELFSSLLKLYSKKAIDAGRQVIYLLNRRGFAPFVICDECGAVMECPHCNISLNFHRSGHLVCHYCGYRRRLPENCLKCGSDTLAKVGSGTQRIEDVISEMFPSARVFRLDQDTSRKKGTAFDLIDMMNSGDIDILLGTQMVAKGFDFHNVSVVGVVLADIGLNLPDFRASERIFSLLIQVAGRCGRGSTPGSVVIQTFNEEHYIFSFLKNHDYFGFYRHELDVRRVLDYPPFSRMARILARGRKEESVSGAIGDIAAKLRSIVSGAKLPVSILGPSEAPLQKIGDNFRHHIILKSHDADGMRNLIAAARECAVPRNVYLEIDIDPYDLL